MAPAYAGRDLLSKMVVPDFIGGSRVGRVVADGIMFYIRQQFMSYTLPSRSHHKSAAQSHKTSIMMRLRHSPQITIILAIRATDLIQCKPVKCQMVNF